MNRIQSAIELLEVGIEVGEEEESKIMQEVIDVLSEPGGCRHTIGTAVDEDGCCVSCGQDINFIAINDKLQAEIKRLKRIIKEEMKGVVDIGRQAGASEESLQKHIVVIEHALNEKPAEPEISK